MILDQVTDAEIAAARIFGGAVMVAFLAAPMFRRQAQTVRVAIARLYIVGLAAFILYAVF